MFTGSMHMPTVDGLSSDTYIMMMKIHPTATQSVGLAPARSITQCNVHTCDGYTCTIM